MTFSKLYYSRYALLFSIALMSSPLFANSEAGEGHAAHEGGLGWSFAFKVINFAVFFYILWRVAKKQLPGILQKRRADLAEAMEAAEKKEKEAHALLQEYDRKLGDLGMVIQKTLNEARTQAESEKQRIIEQAKHEAAEIIKSAERSAKSLESRVAADLRNLATTEALRLTEQKVRDAFAGDANKKKQADLIQRFVAEVGTLEER